MGVVILLSIVIGVLITFAIGFFVEGGPEIGFVLLVFSFIVFFANLEILEIEMQKIKDTVAIETLNDIKNNRVDILLEQTIISESDTTYIYKFAK